MSQILTAYSLTVKRPAKSLMFVLNVFPQCNAFHRLKQAKRYNDINACSSLHVVCLHVLVNKSASFRLNLHFYQPLPVFVCVCVYVILSSQECLLCQHSATVVVVVSPALRETHLAAFYQPDMACPFKRREVNKDFNRWTMWSQGTRLTVLEQTRA